MNEVNKLKQAAHLVGHTDEELEKLSSSIERFEKGIAPWVTWESESSSFGKTFRWWARYPKFLPIYLCSNHGVGLESTCYPNEVESPYVFFTWNGKKNENLNSLPNKKSYHVPHPWVFYRRKHYGDIPQARIGTLVFLAHSNSTTTPIFDDLEGYINNLKSLPEKYQPLVICLSFQDVNKGFHKKLRKYDVPIVTAGKTSSQRFVDRFYSLTYQFKYSTSSDLGSFAFYLIEAGIPFFLYGSKSKYRIIGSKAVEDGVYDHDDFGSEYDRLRKSNFTRLVSERVDEVTPEQRVTAEEFLGVNSSMTRIKFSFILWREFFLHFGDFLTAYLRILRNKLMAGIKSFVSS